MPRAFPRPRALLCFIPARTVLVFPLSYPIETPIFSFLRKAFLRVVDQPVDSVDIGPRARLENIRAHSPALYGKPFWLS